ncbi:polysaccharide biosynthesis/export family protein [Candidatus Proelusimicrobium volucris]|uniref:polysaccharide biosynthesis/export family protein n=1 Tax=Candidatus Proelusimicrobium volucris TaxID=3416225 RepID=UPI003D0C40AB
MKYYSIIIFLAFAAILNGCGSPAKVNNSLITEINNGDITQDLNDLKGNSDYILQPGDLVEIQVFMEDDMKRILRIATNGTITYPLIGNIKISGYSVSDAEYILSSALKKYIKNPQVSMLIQEYGNKTVYVLGQVAKPAAIQIPPEKPLTVLEAITSVGGFTDIAAVSRVRVLRMENGKQTSIDVDVTQITKQGNKALDIPLKPGDVVFVPQSIF